MRHLSLHRGQGHQIRHSPERRRRVSPGSGSSRRDCGAQCCAGVSSNTVVTIGERNGGYRVTHWEKILLTARQKGTRHHQRSPIVSDYRAVMDLVLQGWSVRQNCSTVRCSHTTVQKPATQWRHTRSQPVNNSPVLQTKKWPHGLFMADTLPKATSCPFFHLSLPRHLPVQQQKWPTG